MARDVVMHLTDQLGLQGCPTCSARPPPKGRDAYLPRFSHYHVFVPRLPLLSNGANGTSELYLFTGFSGLSG